MSAPRAFARLEQAWRFQELVRDDYLEECARALRNEMARRELDFVVQIDKSEQTTNLIYFMAARGIRADVVSVWDGPGLRILAQPLPATAPHKLTRKAF